MNQNNGLEIAVIGMAGRFPGARNIEEFWKNLENGIESISVFSEEELIESGVSPGELQNPNYVKAKGYIKDVEYFDAAFFRFSSREAEMLDPQIRVLHECAWEALEHAGYIPNHYEGDIGFFSGATTNFNWTPLSAYVKEGSKSESYEAGTLAYKDAISTLISYKLNLRGPSLSLYTACSTSLAAIHQACRSLLLGECSIALAGGVSIRFPKKNGYLYQEGMIESPDGHCRPFDAKAMGSVFGDGAGIVVLKRLEEALADGDSIHAVIKSTAMNNDGSNKVGYTAPSVEGQTEVIRKALSLAEVDKESISYIEAHGSGTRLGDPIEIQALEKAFNLNNKRICAIGSVKSNVGHLDTASGVAGFIKTVLSLKHKMIPPSLHFETPNPEINFDESPFYVNDQLTKWNNKGYPLRAGVSSFGLGGTNVHVILEEAPVQPIKLSEKEDELLVLSAKSEAVLERMAGNLAAYLQRNTETDLADVAYTLQVGRDVYPYRNSMVCASSEEAIEQLLTLSTGGQKAIYTKENRQVIFMFTGQSAQYAQMGRELYEHESVFKDTIDECFILYRDLTGADLKPFLYPSETPVHVKEAMMRTEISQPTLFIFAYALAKLLMSWGIRPDGVIGYSFGEYAAACIAGVFTLKDALDLVVRRGQLMQSLPGGAMISVPLSEEQLRPLLEDGVSIGVVNNPSCIVSGSEEAIVRFEQKMRERKLLCMRINTHHAAHSMWMEPIVQELRNSLKAIQFGPLQIPYISGMNAKPALQSEIADSNYWVKQMVEPVRFSEAIVNLCENSSYAFIEIGPGRELSTMIRRHLIGGNNYTVDLVQPEEGKMSDYRYTMKQLGKLWSYGVNVDWESLHVSKRKQRVPLPAYPFEKKYYWPAANETRQLQAASSNMIDDRRKRQDSNEWFYYPLWKQSVSGSRQRKMTMVSECILLFMDEYGVGEALGDSLRKSGSTIIEVRPGEGFMQLDEYTFVIDPGSEKDYTKVFKALKQSKHTLSYILHAYGLHSEPKRNEHHKSSLKGYYSLLYTAKAVASEYLSAELQIDVIANNIFEVTGNEALYPEHSTILGPFKVIPQEYTNVGCRLIEVDLGEWHPEGALAAQLKREIGLKHAENTVSLRNGKRWVRLYEQAHLHAEEEENRSVMRDEGVYLITGGTGAIGLELATHLASTKKARVALIHRSFFPPREQWEQWLQTHPTEDEICTKILKLLEIERFAGGLMLERADVSDYIQFQAAVEKIESKFAPINGIIHAAGTLTNDSFFPIADTGNAESENQFTAKIDGVLVIEQLFRNKDLDFCVLMSSISSVLGGIGHTAYCAANSFMDIFAHYQNRNNRVQWISVNWDGWLVKNNTDGAWGEVWESTAMLPAEGVKAFEQIVNSVFVSQVVNSTANLHTRLELWSELSHTDRTNMNSPSSLLMPRPDLSSVYEAPRHETERTLIQIFEQIVSVDGIGIHDDFLELGGDSLKAITALSMIRKQFNKDIPLDQFFKNLTVEKITLLISALSGEEPTHYTEGIKPAAEAEFYPLSPGQKRMYLMDQIHSNSTLYNTTIFKELDRSHSIEKIELIFAILIERHESLRTSFLLKDEMPYQKVHDHIEFSVRPLRYAADREQYGQIVKAFLQPFDLHKAPLMRVGYMETGGEKNILIIDIHHIITDLLSMDILQREFNVLLNKGTLDPMYLQYKDYVVWMDSLTYQSRMVRQKEYWLSKFNVEPPLIDLPIDFMRNKVKTYSGSTILFELDMEYTNTLREKCRECDATLFMFLLTAFNILLYRLTGQTDLVIGVPVAGRNFTELNGITGLFTNTLPIRHTLTSDQTYLQLLHEIKNNVLEAFDHQEYPFEDLVENVVKGRDTGRNPLFDVMFNLLDRREDMDLQGESNKEQYGHFNTSKFDLSLTVRETKEKLFFEMEYSTELFKESTVRMFSNYYLHLVRSGMFGEDASIDRLEIVPEQHLYRLYNQLNATQRDYPVDLTVLDLFDEQTRNHPTRTALLHDDKEMTYDELYARSKVIARELRSKGIGRGHIAGILLDHSFEAIAAILGVMRTGAAYLPIDVNYPEERIRYLLEDSRSEIVLVSGNSRSMVYSCQVLIVDDETLYNNILVNAVAKIDDMPELSLKDPVYVMYTSGSTGSPKGVVISHQSLMNHICWVMRTYLKAEDELICPLYSSLSFDMTVTSLFAPLATGNKMVIYSGETGNKEMVLQRVLEDNVANLIKLTPSQLRLIKELGIKASSIRTLVVIGELLTTALARDIHQLFDGKVVIFNEYGPTEATVGCILHEFKIESDDRISVPIGVPGDNTRIYLMDEQMNLVPEGIPGEIFISGDCVAKGYLFQPELTSERFLLDPLVPGSVMYKTDDLARLLPDGTMEYLGRKDQQVKIRGFRIEPGEIMNVLAKHPAVRECVVVARNYASIAASNDKYLCAYYIPERAYQGDLLINKELERYLEQRLPAYLVPQYFVQLDVFPVTSNGKLAIDLLPEPGMSVSTEIIAAESIEEQMLLEIWSDVLSREAEGISVDASFFEMGGQSLNASIMAARIHKEFSIKLPLIVIFQHPRIRELAKWIREASSDVYTPISRLSEQEYYAIAPAQQKLYFIQQLNPKDISYNLPMFWELLGNLNHSRFKSVLHMLLERQDILRTSFVSLDGKVYQRLRPADELEIEYYDVSDFHDPTTEAARITNGFSRPFNLDRIPMRVGLIKVTETNSVLMVDIHHIITDAISMGILASEFMTIYAGENLPELSVSYRDYAAWYSQLCDGDRLKQQKLYWQEVFHGDIPVLQLPTDFQRPIMRSFEGSHISFRLSQETTQQLKQLALHEQSTLFILLLATYNVLLSKLSGQQDIVVGTDTAGRGHSDVRQLIGNFVNTLALRNFPLNELTFKTFAAEVKQRLLDAYENQDFQFEQVVEMVTKQRDLSHNPLFDVMFGFLSHEIKELSIEGLTLRPYEQVRQTAIFDLVLQGYDNGETIEFVMEYSTKLFTRATVEMFIQGYKEIINQIIVSPETKLADIQFGHSLQSVTAGKSNELEGDFLF